MTETSASTRLLSALRQTARILDARHQPWALVGGLAVSIRVEPRFTRDIDLAVSVADDAAAEALVGDLVAAGFTLNVSLEQRALGQPRQGARRRTRTMAGRHVSLTPRPTLAHGEVVAIPK